MNQKQFKKYFFYFCGARRLARQCIRLFQKSDPNPQYWTNKLCDLHRNSVLKSSKKSPGTAPVQGASTLSKTTAIPIGNRKPKLVLFQRRAEAQKIHQQKTFESTVLKNTLRTGLKLSITSSCSLISNSNWSCFLACHNA
jgi:hypothetical protein